MRTCNKCNAYYKVGDWYVGFYEGTSSDFQLTLKIVRDKCPVWLAPKDNK